MCQQLRICYSPGAGDATVAEHQDFPLVVTEEVTMLSGRVKWFDAVRGYGFIIPDDGGRDLFVHITAVRQAGYTSLVPGTRLSYEIRPDREGNPTAESLKIGYRPE